MFEIMFHGRSGQGAVLAATLLANTAAGSGYQAQAFASYGGERRGGKMES
jgi:pyruvate ferredoxin oxidoreductase gamma subunit